MSWEDSEGRGEIKKIWSKMLHHTAETEGSFLSQSV